MSDRDEIEKVLAAYVTAYRAGNASGCAGVYTPDAQLMSPYGPAASGRADIEALHREWFEDSSENKSLTIREFGSSGDVAWCLAVFSEADATDDGLSLNVFERQTNGQWLIRMSSLNEILGPD